MVKKQTVFLGLLVLALMLCVSVVGAQDNTVVGSEHSVFSVRLPQGYVSKPLPIPNFSDVVAFGSSSGALSFIEGVIAGQQGSGSDTGVGGFIGQLDLSRATAAQTPASLAPQLMQVMIQAIAGNNVQFIQQTAPHTFGGQYNGLLALTQAGYIGVINTDKELFLIVVLTDNLSTNQTTMNAIMDSIRVPPESASQQPTPVTQLQPTTEGAATATAVESLTVRSSDQRVSLDVPADWTVMDRIADQNTLVYGNSPEAAQSRLASARPDLAQKAPISGNGGLVILYPAAQFNINPQSPDLGPLMTQALAQLKSQGYATDAPIALESIQGGLYAYIEGTEVGYLALIPFGDQIAYVTATGTKDSFDAADDALVAIIESVRSPAAPEAPGLGGLGGLQAAATQSPGLGGLDTAAPTATVPVPGLGGLGAPNATQEASS